jgi:hypothetical protein
MQGLLLVRDPCTPLSQCTQPEQQSSQHHLLTSYWMFGLLKVDLMTTGLLRLRISMIEPSTAFVQLACERFQ